MVRDRNYLLFNCVYKCYTITATGVCSVANNCSQLCSIVNGVETCSCERGYLLDGDGVSCNGKNYALFDPSYNDAIGFVQMLMSVTLMEPAVKTVLTLLAHLFVLVMMVIHWTVMAELVMVNR